MQISAAKGDRRCPATSSGELPPASDHRYPEERRATASGAIAQLEEHLLCKQGVTSSSLVSSTRRNTFIWILNPALDHHG